MSLWNRFSRKQEPSSGLTSVARNRRIRVFVSSTFRDMQAEREELAKRVFPELRKRCEARGVVRDDVDLRWGITEEAAAEGKVLPICLEEIRGCRPYFIGVLGERYGCIPQQIPLSLIEAQPWLAENRDRSVTELAILFAEMGHTDEALVLNEHLLDLYRRMGDEDKLASCLGNTAVMLEDCGEPDRAMAHLKDQERICRGRRDMNGLSTCLCNQASSLWRRGRLDEAMRLLEEEELICRELGEMEELAICLENQAAIPYARGDLDRALVLGGQAERIWLKLGDRLGVAHSRGQQALVLRDRRDLRGASRLLREEEGVCRELGDMRGLARSLMHQAWIVGVEMRNIEAGLDLADEALRVAGQCGHRSRIDQIESVRAQILARAR